MKKQLDLRHIGVIPVEELRAPGRLFDVGRVPDVDVGQNRDHAAIVRGDPLHVRLEDLCEAPKRTVRRLFEFVGSEAPMKPAVGEVMTPPSLGRWREHPEAEVACLTALGEDALRRFGYLSPS